MKKSICMIIACLVLLGMAGCSNSAQKAQDTNIAGFSLTNSILGEDYLFTYSEAPGRIVSLASPATEMLLALGLEESIVGYAMQDNEIPAQYPAVSHSEKYRGAYAPAYRIVLNKEYEKVGTSLD